MVLSKGNTLIKSALHVTAIFDWVSKVSQDCTGFIFFRYLTDVENLRHPFNQSDAKTNTDFHLVTRVFPRFRQIACF